MSAAKVSHGVTETRREDSASVRPAVAPALRFKGFDLSEETVVFGEVVSRRKSGARSTRELPSVEYEDVVPFEGRLCRDVKAKRDGRQGIRFSEGDVLFGKLRPYLGNWLRASFDGVAVGDWWVLEPLGLRGSYLYQLIQSNPFQLIANQSSGSKMPRSDWSVVVNGQFRVVVDPKQQEALGCFLASIDSLRATSQSALAKLQALKKSMLVNMFPQGDAKVPKIRFRGFEGEWKKSTLSDYLTVSTENNMDLAFGKGNVLSVSGDVGVVNQIRLLGRSYAGASIFNYHVLRKGQVVYTKSPLKHCPFGIIKSNKSEDGIVSVLYGVYNHLEDCDPDFVHAYFDSVVRLNNYLRALVKKGAKNTLLITDEEALAGNVVFPSLTEQRKIAAYFKSLDRLIAARRDEIEQLKHMKAALLNRMFV